MKDTVLKKVLRATKARARACERELATIREREAALLADAQKMTEEATRAAIDSAGSQSGAELKHSYQYGQTAMRLAEKRKAQASNLEEPIEAHRAKLLSAIRNETVVTQMDAKLRAYKQRRLNEFEERSLEELNRLKAQ